MWAAGVLAWAALEGRQWRAREAELKQARNLAPGTYSVK
jgi:hypothetical protein